MLCMQGRGLDRHDSIASCGIICAAVPLPSGTQGNIELGGCRLAVWHVCYACVKHQPDSFTRKCPVCVAIGHLAVVIFLKLASQHLNAPLLTS